MRHSRRFWCVALGGLTALNLWFAFNKIPGDSLSENFREVFGTDTPEGRLRFVGAYVGFSAWFIPHIIKKIKED